MERLRKTVESITSLDEKSIEGARGRQRSLTKPLGSLGVLEELAVKIAGIKGEEKPKIHQKAIITMAADHGVVEEGVSAYPSEVTSQMVTNFLHGGAAINVLARHIGASVVVVDMGVACELIEDPRLLIRKVGPGTKNMACGPAMSRDEAVTSIEMGIEIVESEKLSGFDIIGTGDMGIGNTTASAAIASVMCGISPFEAAGRGTGISDQTFEKKVRVIENAISLNNPDKKDGIDVLSKIGGFEIGGIAGVILGAAANRIPVVLDGYISGAAALIANAIAPKSREYMIASHLSVEKGHRRVLRKLDLDPVLDLNLRLGEGTGAALAISIVDGACKILDEMATFQEAGVSEKIN